MAPANWGLVQVGVTVDHGYRRVAIPDDVKVRRLENRYGPSIERNRSDIARRLGVPLATVQALCQVEALDKRSSLYWHRMTQIQSRLKGRWHPVQQAVLEAMAQTPRASSIIENLNSRLRSYFFLRREIGHGYLHLLRFFLNHRRFLRSDRPERVGKSPAELLTGQRHPHWLEILGYTRFHRN